MFKFEINKIPELIISGKITEEQAVKDLAVFLTANWAIFNLQNQSDDLKSEIILYLLEKGNSFISNYRPQAGTFFNYFYCYVKNIVLDCQKKKHKQTIIENYNYNESIKNYELEASDRFYPPQENYSGKIPFAYKIISPSDFQIACKTPTYKFKEKIKKNVPNDSELLERILSLPYQKTKKILIVLALKSAYYISEEQIEKICEICNLDTKAFIQTINMIREQLEIKVQNRRVIEMRRNKAYFNHNKYKDRLEWIENCEDINKKYEKSKIEKKYLMQTKNWLVLNNLLSNGYVNIRPTNKTISQIIGMCERQVSYYIKNARELGINI